VIRLSDAEIRNVVGSALGKVDVVRSDTNDRRRLIFSERNLAGLALVQPLRDLIASVVRDLSFELVDWDVVYGHVNATPKDEVSHDIASYLQDRAAEIEKGSG
jgi:hypothetical protein